MIQSIDIPALPGHADAFGELLMGGASHDVQHLEVGVCFAPQPGEADSYGSSDFTMVDGYGGTTSGSIGTNVAKLYAANAPQQICVAEALPHVGVKRIRARVHATAESYVRFRWRLATGAWIFGRWVKVDADTWQMPLLGVADVPKLPAGHSWTVGIDAYSPSGATVSLDKINPLAADRWMTAVTPPAGQTLILSDDFNQSAGNATGKNLDVGGTWSGGGDSDDFTIDAANGRLQRTAVSDTVGAGRYIYAGPAVTECRASVEFIDTSPYNVQQGLLLRYVDSNNYAYAVGVDDLWGVRYVKMMTVVAGTHTMSGDGAILSGPRPFVATIKSSGLWRIGDVGHEPGSPQAAGVDLVFATGGALASGKMGIYDEWNSSAALTRNYDNFRAWDVQRGGVIFSGEESRLSHDRLEAEQPGGAWGAIPGVRGDYLKLPSGRALRLVVSASQYDVDTGAQHLPLTSPLDLDLAAIPRVTMLGAS